MNGQEQEPKAKTGDQREAERQEEKARMEAESHKRPNEIEEDLERTRMEMDETIGAIERKFSPGEMIDYTLSYLSSGPREYAANLGNAVKANPLPTALMGIGLAWLMASSSSGRPHYPEKTPVGGGESSMKGKYGQAREKAGAAAGRVRESFGRFSQAFGSRRQAAGEQLGRSREQAGQMAGMATEQGMRMRQQYREYIEDQPLVLSALGFALGAALGAALPESQAESRLMGEKRDQLLEQAKRAGKERLEEGKEVAAAAMEAAREETERRTEEASRTEEKKEEPAL